MKTKLTTDHNHSHSKIAPLALALLMTCRLANAQCVAPPAGIVAWWQGEGNAKDIIGTNNGTFVGAAYVTGEVGQGFNFDGIANYISVPDSPSLNPSSAMSVEAWYRPVSFVGTGNDAIVDKGYPTYNNPFYQYHLGVTGDQYQNGAGDHAEFNFNIAIGGTLVSVFTQAGIWTPGNWYHLVGTYDGTAVRLFVNGNLVAQTAASGSISAFGQPLYLGRYGARNSYLPGVVDEVSIYNRAISSNEVVAIYAAGSAGKCQSPFIIDAPKSQVGYLAGSVTFSVTAAPVVPNLSYQWQTNNVPIPSATNQTLIITNLQYMNAAAYTVVVTNIYGSTTSAPPALLTVDNSSIALYPGVTIYCNVGTVYGIQASTDLSNTNGWFGVANVSLTNSAQIWFDSTPATLSKRFYRVLPGPISIP